MSIDFDALRQKLNTFKGINDRQQAVWKPKEGRTTIRIVPWKGNRNNPFVELYFHYLSRPYLSPLTNGNPDPIAEFADKLRLEGTSESYSQAKQFMPKLRTYVPVVVRGEESEGVRFWSFGKTVYQEILSIIADPDYGDITDPISGRDVVVEYTPQEKSDTNFAKTVIRVKPNVTPLSEESALSKEWISTQPDISEIYKEPTYKELSLVLEKYIDHDSVPAGTTKAAANASPPKSASATASEETTDNVKSAVAAFDELFSK